jgi:hypothetical protein
MIRKSILDESELTICNHESVLLILPNNCVVDSFSSYIDFFLNPNHKQESKQPSTGAQIKSNRLVKGRNVSLHFAPRGRPGRTLAPPPSLLLSSPLLPAPRGQSPRGPAGGGLFLTRARYRRRGVDVADDGALRGIGDSVRRRGGKAWLRWL